MAGVTLSVSPTSVGEGDENATEITVTATVTGASRYAAEKTVTVAVGDDDDDATEGTDYTAIADKTITLPLGATSADVTFDLEPLEDTLDEVNEQISVTGAVGGEPTTVTGATLTITDNDDAASVVRIANADAVTEGNAGATTDMTFTVSMTPASGRAVTVPFTLSGTATGGGDDYVTPDPLSVTIPKGDTSVDLDIAVKGDINDEPNETVIVTLGDPDHAALHATQKAGTGAITDDDDAVAGVTLSVSPTSVAESATATEITVTATVTGPTRFGAGKTVTVTVGADADAAEEGVDYDTVGAVTITLPEGADSAEASFDLTPTDDALDEDDEEISVTGAVTGETTTVTGTAVTITDDDAATSKVSVADAADVAEGDDPDPTKTTDMTFAVSIAPASGRAVTVPYTLTGTATAGADYTGTASGSVTIAKGAASATITVPIRGDILDETDETVIVTLGNPDHADIDSAQNAGTATGTIKDNDAAVAGVTLSVSPSSVGEGDENATEITVTATVTGASRYAAQKTVTVAVGAGTDTATEGTDYGTVGTVTITLPLGATSADATFDLTPTDDELDEDDEEISVTGAVTGETTTVTGATVTITDDDETTSEVSVANATDVTEGNDSTKTTDMSFAVSMTPVSGRLVTVPYTLTGTATAGDDYTGTASGSVTLAKGETSATITVPVKGDVLDESNETVIVTLGNPDHADIDSAQNAGTATGIITDDDDAVAGVTLSVNPDTVGEDDAATTAITVTATVTGASRFAAQKTVNVTVGAGTDSATEGTDYDAVGAVTITLPLGATSAEASFDLTPTDDELDEDDEKISVTGTVAGEPTTVTGTTVTITDDDETTSVVSVANATDVTEGNDTTKTTDMTFAVSMAPVSGRLVTVPYTLTGTATAGDDYTGTASGSVTLAKGATSATITVPVKGDVLDESNETVIVTLGAPTNADISSAQDAGTATGEIADDDDAVAGVTLSVSPTSVGEGDENATEITVTATVTGASRYAAEKTVTVAVGDDDDDATEGTDYTAIADKTITLPLGATSADVTFDLEPLEDTLDEVNEQISVTGAVGGEPTTVTGATLTITDNDDAASVVRIANADAVTEGNAGATTDMTFTVSMTPASGRAVTVPFTLSGTATGGGDDYVTPDPLSVTIPKGDTSVDLDIAVKGDINDEPNETVIVTLGDPDHAALHATQKAGTGAITDDDAVAGVTLSVSPTSVAESATATEITVTATVTGPTRFGAQKTVTVAVGADADAAEEGVDYDTVGAVTITLPEGADSAEASFDLTPTDDALDEDDEEISVTGAVTGETTTVTGTAVTITDDDAATSKVSVADAADVAEGDDPDPTKTTDMTFAVSIAPASGRAVTVPYTLTGTATAGADYTGTASGSVTIAKGAASATITVPIRGDILDETDETVIVTLGNPDHADIDSAQNAGTATGTIKDNDAAVAGVTLSVSPSSVGEGDENATEITVTATVTGASRYAAQKTVTVAVGAGTDTATEGTDYETVGTVTITLPLGATSADASFDLTPTDDVLDEDDEEISVTGAVTGETTTVTGATLTITDDDATPTVAVGNATAVTEGDNPGTTVNMTFTVTLSAVGGRTVTVPYTLTGTATAPDDYTVPNPRSVEIAAGANSANIVIPVKGDTLDETNETIIVTLGNPINATISTAQGAGTGEGEITDDDDPPVISISSPSVTEGDSDDDTDATLTFTVSLDAASGKTVTVAYADAETGTATSETDYAEITGATLTFTPGQTEKTVDVTVTGDELDEDNETVVLRLSSPTNATLSGGATTLDGTGTITDDDTAALSIDDVTVAEGATATFTITLSTQSATDVTVTATTAPGTATAPADYTHKTQALTIDAGDTSAEFTVSVAADTIGELDETFTVVLSAASTTISDGTGIGTITGSGDTLISIANATAVEGSDLSFTLTRSGDLSAASSVTWTTGDDTADSARKATADSDYNAVDTAQTVRFAADETTKTLTVTSLTDDLIDGTETFRVNLASPNGAVLMSAFATGTITEGTTGYAIADGSATEGTAIAFTITRNGLTTGASSVKWVTADDPTEGADKATAGTDYTAVTTAATVSFLANETSKDITVDTTADTTDEPDETFRVNLSDPGAAGTLIRGTATGTIEDNDNPPTVAVGDATAVDEGDNPGATTDMTFPVTLSAASGKTVTMTYTLSGTAEEPVDYTEPDPLSVEIAAGQMSADIEIPIKGDTLDEPDETVVVTLGTLTNATLSSAAGAGTGTGEITDDDDPPVISISAASVTEGDSDDQTAATLTFTVSLDPASGKTVTVAYADTTTGTAASGTDYTAITGGTLSFAAGETEKTVSVTVTGDELDEANETVILRLSSPTNATLSGGVTTLNGTGTITDDDEATLSIDDTTAAEGASATFTIRLSTARSTATTVTATTSTEATDTATAGDDYTAKTQALSIAAGSTTATFTVALIDDSLNELAETFTVTLSDASVTIDDATATGTITGSGSTLISIANASAVEGSDLSFTVTRSGDTTGASSFTWTTGDDTTQGATKATADTDYTEVDTAQTVRFAATETTKSITVTSTADNLIEGPETFRVNLASPTGAVLASNFATGTITEGTTGYAIADASATEGTAIAFTITRTGLTTGASSVKWVTADDTAEGADKATAGTDYTAVTTAATVSFLANETSKDITVDTTVDTTDEPDETFRVNLSDPGAAGTLVRGTATGTIEDNDNPPTVSVGDATAVDEGDLPATTTDMSFPVTLSAASGKTVTVTYTLSGTAEEPADYTEPDPLSVEIAAGQASANIVIPIKGDTLDEPDETVVVTLGALTNATLSSAAGAGTGTGTIEDDDATPTASLTLTPATIDESGDGNESTVTASLSGASSETVTLTVAASGTAGTRTLSDNTTLTITAGATASTGAVSITAVDNDIDAAANATVTVSATASGGGVTNPANATLTITDDDTRGVVIKGSPVTVRESDDTDTTSVREDQGTYTIELATEPTGGTVTVEIESTDATAATVSPASYDFTAANWNNPRTVTVTGVNDDADNPGNKRTVSITHTVDADGTDYEDLAAGAATVEVTDDDGPPSGITLSVNKATVAENAGDTVVRVTATLGAGSKFGADTKVRVTVGKSTDSAASGTDYEAVAAFDVTIAKDAESGAATFTLKPTDDDLDENDETISIEGALTDFTVTSTNITLTDDDTRGVTVTPTTLPALAEVDDSATDDETENEGTYEVVLDSRPTGTVTVNVASSHTNIATVSASTLTFAPGAWNTAQEVTVTAVPDNYDNAGNKRNTTITHTVSATGTDYASETASSVTVEVTDDDAAPAIALSAAPASVAESASATSITVTATLSGTTRFAAEQKVRVTVGDADDAATSGTDYGTVAAFDVTIAKDAASGSASFSLAPTQDTIDEGAGEALTVSGLLAGVTVSGTTVTITDDDATPGGISLSVSPATVAEDKGAAETFTVTASVTGGTEFGEDKTVAIAVGGGTATAGTDYGTVSGFSITIPEGEMSATGDFDLTPTDDTLDEDNETVNVTGTLTGVTLTNTSLTITDDDDPPVISIDSPSVTEGDSDDQTAATLTFTVSLDAASSKTVTVAYADTETGTAASTDYTAITAGTLSFAAGETEKTVDVTVTGDDLDEDNETVVLRLSSPTNATLSGGATSLDGTGTITDDDTATLSIDDATAAEGASATFTIRLSTARSTATTVTATTSTEATDTATAGDDYTAKTQAFTIAAGSTTATFAVAIVDDMINELAETFTVTLSDASVTISDATATGTITGSGSTLISIADATAAEGSNLSFAVTRSGDVSGASSFTWTTGDDTANGAKKATADTDYTAVDTAQTVTFSATEMTKSITVTSTADDLIEGPETFRVNLTNSTGAVLASAFATGTITEGTTGYRINDADADEGETITFTITREGLTTGAGSVKWNTADDTTDGADKATADTDYTEVDTAQTVSFAIGETSKDITVTSLEDTTDEPDETFRVVLSAPTAGILTDAFAIGTINDDDAPTLSIANASASEGDNMTFTISLTSAHDADVEVTATTSTESADTATAGTDYTTKAQDLTLAAGATSVSFTVSTAEDAIDEANETFTVTLTGASPAAVTIADANATGTITDDDERGITISESSVTVRESDDGDTTLTREDQATYTVVLDSEPEGGTVTINLASEDEAIATVSPASIDFTAGNWNNAVTVTVTGVNDDTDNAADKRTTAITHTVDAEDTDYEDEEADDVAVEVTDDDGTPTATLTLAPSRIDESGASNVSTVTANLSNPSGSAVTFTVSAAAVSPAANSAFTLSNNKTLTIAKGATASTGEVTITAVDNAVDAADATVTVSATASGGGVANPAAATLTITDNDTRGVTVTPTALPALAEVDDAGTDDAMENQGVYEVVLTSRPTGTVTVNVASSNTSIATVSASSLTFAPADWNQAQEVTVTAVPDNYDNTGNKRNTTITNTVSATGTDYASETASSVTVEVTDDDAAPAIALSAAPASVAESASATSITVTATLSGTTRFAAEQKVRVTVGDADDAATSGTDYGTVAAFDVTIAKDAASGSASFSLAPTQDTIDEGAGEALTVSGLLAGVTVSGTTVTITDDDATPGGISLSVSPTSVAEDKGAAETFTVTASVTGGTEFGEDKTVAIAVGGGTATAGTDYGTVSGFSITIPEGEMSATGDFDLTPTDDTLDEDNETVNVTGTLTGVTLTNTSLTITDDDDPPVISIGSPSVTEGDSDDQTAATLTFTVSLDAASSKTVTVAYADTTTGTAAAATDYTAITAGTLSFAAGETEKTVDVTVTGDELDEDNETVVLRLSSPTNATLTGGATNLDGTGTITDDDTATLSIDDATAAEGGTATFTIRLSTARSAATTVTATTSTEATDTATAPADYTHKTQALSIAAGSTSTTFTVALIDDSLPELAETFTVTLSVASVTISDATATGTITGSGSTLISIANASAVEGAALSFAVTRSGDTTGASSFTWTTGDDTANGAKKATADTDYTAVSTAQTVRFSATETTKTITVTSTADDLIEGPETFRVNLASPTGAVLMSNFATGTITEGTTGYRINDANADEGEDITFTITREGLTTGAGSVKWNTADDTTDGADKATADTDYTEVDTAETVSFLAGDTSKTITVTSLEDSTDEPDETFRVVLSAPTAGILTDAFAIGTINDDDAPTLSIANAEAGEGNDIAFTISLTSAHDADVEVTATTSTGSDDTATAADDYTHKAQDLTIAQGATSASFTVSTAEDAIDEPDETFTVTLTGASPAAVTIADATATGTINDDDERGITISETAVTVRESDDGDTTSTREDQATYTVVLDSEPSGGTVTINLASEDEDIATVSPASIDFTAGNWNNAVTVTVTGVNDDADNAADKRTTAITHTVDAEDTDYEDEEADDVDVEVTDDDGTPTATLTLSPARIDESGAANRTTVTANLSNPSGSAVTLTVAAAAVAPAANSAFKLSNNTTLTIAKGATASTGEVTITAVDNSVDAPDASVTVSATASGGGVANPADATLTITDDDGEPALSINAPTVTESDAGEDATLTFTIRLAAASGNTVTVDYADARTGTATSATDYTAITAGTLTFNPGVTSQTVDVTVTGDDIDEDNETIILRLSSPTNATLSGGVTTLDGTGTINDDDDAPTVSVGDATAVDEGDNPGATTDMSFTVTLSAVSGKTVTVPYTLSGTATAPGDYTVPNPREVEIAAGSLSADIDIPVKGDTLDETNETIIVTLGTPTGATVSSAAGAGTGTGTINDDDGEPALSINAPTVTERDSGEDATLTFTVSLDAASGKTVTVDYADARTGTATSGTDYTAITAGTLTFNAGVTSQTVDVTVTGDDLDEDNETIILRLSSPTNATLAGGVTTLNGTGTINDDDDDDDATAITISISDAEGPEGSHLEFRVTLSRPSPGDVEVSWGSLSAEAKGDYDFEFEDGRLYFAEGEQEKTIRIEAYGDDEDDPNETFWVDLWNPVGAVLANPVRFVPEAHRFGLTTVTSGVIARATGLITGDAPPPLVLSLEADNTSIPEGASFRLRVKANARNGYNRSIRVPLVYSRATLELGDTNIPTDSSIFVGQDPGDTAKTQLDQEAPSGIWIYAGDDSGNTDIVTYHDADFDDETFTVSIGAVRSYEATVGSPSSVDLTIRDDGGSGNHNGTFVQIGVDADADRGGVQGDLTEDGGAKKVRVTATLRPAWHANEPTRFTEDKTVSITVGKASDSATEGVDYQTVGSLSIVIPARKESASTTFTLTPTDDSLVELDELISVEGALSGLSVRSGTIRMKDDEYTELGIDDVTVAEGDTASFTVSLTEPHTSDVTVTATTFDDTAESPHDYTHKSEELTIAAGQTSVDFEVETLADSAIEGSETFEVRLSGASGAEIADAVGTGAITEGTVGWSVADARATEGETLSFTIAREGKTDAASSVKWSTATDSGGDHPASGDDYTEVTTAQTVNFAADETRKTVTVSTTEDSDDENDETFTVVLSDPGAGGVLLDGTAIGTVVDNDDPPIDLGLVISETSIELVEGASAGFTVKLESRPHSNVAVAISGHAGASISLDATMLEFTPSTWNDAQTVTVTATQDDDTADETATLTLTATHGDDSIAADVEVAVSDDDTPALRLAPSRLAVVQGDSTAYTVRLATRPARDVTVTIGGHTDANLTLDATTLVFTPSTWNRGQQVEVTAAASMDSQDVTATLTHTASGADYGDVDADLEVTVFGDYIKISIEDAEGPEGSYLEFRVTLSRPSPGDVSVSWTTIPGVAKAHQDFEEISRRMQFREGESEKIIRIWAIEDDVDDPYETFTVQLTDPFGAVLENPVTTIPQTETLEKTIRTGYELIYATGTIVGPGPPPLELSIGAEHRYIEEGSSTTVLVTASVPNELNRQIRVPLVYANGTAEAGDYEGDTGLWIHAGSKRGTARLRVFQDDDSDDETLTVSIGEPRQYEAYAGSNNSVRLTILDDDGAAGDFQGLTVTAEDAEAVEGVDNLDFQLRLNRPAPGPVTVRAETKSGTATEDSDYNRWAGEVQFAAGERVRTVSVWVNDDDIDEGHESMTLELSNPDPAEVAIARATATGTIKNSDPIPGAWLARFGRGLAQQTVDSVADRLQARREPGFQGSVPMLGLNVQARPERGRDGAEPGPASSGPAAGGGGSAPEDEPSQERNPGFATGPEPMLGETATGAMATARAAGTADGLGTAGGLGTASGPGAAGAAASPLNGFGPPMVLGTPGSHSMGGAYSCAGSTPGASRMGSSRTGLAQMGSTPMNSTPSGTSRIESPRTGAGSGSAAGALAGNCAEQASIGEFFLQALFGASFTRTGKADPNGGTIAWWGRGERSQFSASDSGLGLEGEIASGRLGVDYARENWLAGLALAHSVGQGDWSGGAGGGQLEASLTSLSPYAALSISDRLDAWSTAGAGWGTLRLAHGNGGERTERLETDLRWQMAAAGARGDLFRSTEGSGPELSLIADALWSSTSSGQIEGLAASRSAVTRLRLGLEGSWAARLNGGGSLTPTLDLAARHDGGDAETGFGVDLGGGIAWTAPKRGISLGIEGRALVAHEDADARDWGASATFAYRANPDSERGLALKLGQELGGQSSGALASLFATDVPGQQFDASGGGRWTSELTYGFPVMRDRFMARPSVSYGFSDMARDYSLGFGLTPTKHGPDVTLEFLSTWRDNGLEAPEPGIRIGIRARW